MCYNGGKKELGRRYAVRFGDVLFVWATGDGEVDLRAQFGCGVGEARGGLGRAD